MSSKKMSTEELLIQVKHYINDKYGSDHPKTNTDKGSEDYFLFKEKDLERFIKSISIELPHKDLDRFHRCMDDITMGYFPAKFESTIRPAEKKKQLMALAQEAFQFMKCLYGIDSLVLFALMDTIDEIPGDWVPAFLENPEHRRNTNDWIMLNSSTDFLKICYMACLAIDKIPNDKGGRPKNFPLNRLVYDLASAYKQFTGKKPTRIYDGMNQMPIGPFFSFVKAYLDIVDPGGYYSENSIDNAIKETMSRWEAENTATLNDKQEQNHP